MAMALALAKQREDESMPIPHDPSQPCPLPPLPLGTGAGADWVLAFAPDGRQYYYNPKTSDVSWTLPAAAQIGLPPMQLPPARIAEESLDAEEAKILSMDMPHMCSGIVNASA